MSPDERYAETVTETFEETKKDIADAVKDAAPKYQKLASVGVTVFGGGAVWLLLTTERVLSYMERGVEALERSAKAQEQVAKEVGAIEERLRAYSIDVRVES